MKDFLDELKPLVFHNQNLVLNGYEEIDERSIIDALNAFLLTTEFKQLTYVFKSGKQGHVFSQVMPEFKKGNKYIFENHKGVSKIIDLIYFDKWDFMYKNYLLIKDTHKVLSAFYYDENQPDTGYWTFIKGNNYETP